MLTYAKAKPWAKRDCEKLEKANEKSKKPKEFDFDREVVKREKVYRMMAIGLAIVILGSFITSFFN
jgi:hypothetical protein